MKRVAILVDGGFYRKRAANLFGEKSAQDRADELENYCRMHLKSKQNKDAELYSVPSQQKWTQKSFKKRNESQYFVNLRKPTAFIPRFA